MDQNPLCTGAPEQTPAHTFPAHSRLRFLSRFLTLPSPHSNPAARGSFNSLLLLPAAKTLPVFDHLHFFKSNSKGIRSIITSLNFKYFHPTYKIPFLYVYFNSFFLHSSKKLTFGRILLLTNISYSMTKYLYKQLIRKIHRP